MNAKELIKASLNANRGRTLAMLQNMKDAPLTMPTSKGGNHPLWTLGHLAYAESAFLDEMILGKPNRFAEWKPLFHPGTTPIPEADRYPSMDELLAAWDAVRADVLKHLDALSDADLDEPSHAPKELPPVLSTVGGCFSVIILHEAFHQGQVADARRAAGRKPLMM